MTREPDIAEAAEKAAGEADSDPAHPPQGAPDPSVPAGEPEAPVGPTSPPGRTPPSPTRPRTTGASSSAISSS